MDDMLFCRVCFEAEREEDQLISPCACKGSQQVIHLSCHRTWQKAALRTENARRAYVCSVCGTTFKAPFRAAGCPMDMSVVFGPLHQAVRDAASFVSEVSMSPSWLVKSLLLVALSCSLPYAVLAYYGLALTLLSIVPPFHEPAVPVGLSSGRLLVATRRIPPTSMFHQSVVFLIDHGPQGARGVILNRPLPQAYRASLLRDPFNDRAAPASGHSTSSDDDEEEDLAGPWSVSLGGPVEPDSFVVLHNDPRARWAKEVLPGVQVGTNLQELLLLTRHWDREGSTSSPLARRRLEEDGVVEQRQEEEEGEEEEGGGHVARVMFGYSGWGPKQLESEVRRGDWVVAEATAEDVLCPTGVMSTSGLWRSLLQRATTTMATSEAT